MRWVKRKKPSPYALGSSQDIHFVFVASLSTIQTLQVHAPGGFIGILSPAAAQLKPPEGIAGLGRGSSQEAHLVLAGSLSTMQTLHVHVPGALIGILSPAAAQLKSPVGATGLGSFGTAAGIAEVPLVTESGRGSSHETHLNLLASLGTIQTPHVQEPTAFTGAFAPAASQLKPTGAGSTPRANANVGRDDGSTTKAAVCSLACFKGG